jgi:hypothetical protein
MSAELPSHSLDNHSVDCQYLQVSLLSEDGIESHCRKSREAFGLRPIHRRFSLTEAS